MTKPKPRQEPTPPIVLQGAMAGEQFKKEPAPPGTAHKPATAGLGQTSTGVVGYLQEAGHRMQEQQGADNPGAL
jgi:hypothetical protein